MGSLCSEVVQSAGRSSPSAGVSGGCDQEIGSTDCGDSALGTGALKRTDYLWGQHKAQVAFTSAIGDKLEKRGSSRWRRVMAQGRPIPNGRRQRSHAKSRVGSSVMSAESNT